MTKTVENERFKNSALEYAAYLTTPEGRLRSDLAFANLEEFLPHTQSTQPPRALDVGCGTGIAAVRLARLGFHVTLLDSSQAMIDLAERSVEEAKVGESITWIHGDVNELASLLGDARFDVIVCHNVLEFLDNPTHVLGTISRALRDPFAILSVVVRRRAGEVMKSAILAGDLKAAENALTSDWGQESLYGGNVRLFTSHDLQAMLSTVSLVPLAERGVRVLADYLPPHVSRSTEYTRIFELERKLGMESEYAGVARYTQCLARRL